MDKRSLLFVAVFMTIMIGVNLFFGYREAQKAPPSPIVQEKVEAAPETSISSDEKFYVLSNGYQQLVFSNRGGALAEINLPFEGKGDPKNVVKEIGFGREMEAKAPYNDYFPESAYFVPGDSPTSPKAADGKSLGGYYPLLRRTLVEKDGERIEVAPRYYALNIVSKYPEMAEQVYQVKSFEKNRIVFESTQNRRKITKTFSLPDNPSRSPYVIDLEVAIEGETGGLYLTSGVPEVEWLSGSSIPVLKMREVRGNKTEMEKISLPKKGQMVQAGSLSVDWLCNSNGFFGLILDPLGGQATGYKAERIPGDVVPSRLLALQETNPKFKPQNLPGYCLQMPLSETAKVQHFRVFAGGYWKRLGFWVPGCLRLFGSVS